MALLSAHPLVLTDLQAALGRAGFRIHALALQPGIFTEPERLRLPQARVFVLDGQGPRAATQRLAGAILRQQPGVPVVVLAEEFTEASSFPLLRRGVRGLLTYAVVQAQLQRAVQAVAAGSYWVPRILLARFVDSILRAGPAVPAADSADLSRREREVLDALLANLSNKEIAARLNISERTVKFHVSSILAKFGVQRRADLIVRFYQERAR